MAKTNTQDIVVGVFLDPAHAETAIQALRAAGYTPRIADESTLRSFKGAGYDNDVVDLYLSRQIEGNTVVVVEAGNQGEDALGIMLQNGAEYIDLVNRGKAQQGTT